MRYLIQGIDDMRADTSPLELGQIYLDLHHRIRRLVDDAMSETGVSLSRAKVLGQLAQHGPINQAAIAVHLGFAPRSVTDTVDALVRDGLAARADDPKDRRAWLVEITPDGTAALTRALAAKRKLMDQIFGTLDAPARTECAAMLTAIATSLTSPPGGCFAE